MENNQRLSKVKEAITINQSPHVMNREQGAYNNRPLFTTRNQPTGNSSKSRDVTRSRSQSNPDEPIQEYASVCNCCHFFINDLHYVIRIMHA